MLHNALTHDSVCRILLNHQKSIISCGSKGCADGSRPPPPLHHGPNFSQFHAIFLETLVKIICWRLSLTEGLDAPLIIARKKQKYDSLYSPVLHKILHEKDNPSNHKFLRRTNDNHVSKKRNKLKIRAEKLSGNDGGWRLETTQRKTSSTRSRTHKNNSIIVTARDSRNRGARITCTECRVIV